MFVGFFGKDLFVGPGTDVWQQSINILPNTNFFETELSFIFGGTLAFNKLFPLFITIFASVFSLAVLLL